MIKIPFTTVRFCFRSLHWVNAAEMTHEGYYAFFSVGPFVVMKEKAGNDFHFIFTHFEGEPR